MYTAAGVYSLVAPGFSVMHDPTGGRRTKSRNGVYKTTPKTSLEGKIQPNAFICHSIDALLHAAYLRMCTEL